MTRALITSRVWDLRVLGFGCVVTLFHARHAPEEVCATLSLEKAENFGARTDD